MPEQNFVANDINRDDEKLTYMCNYKFTLLGHQRRRGWK